MCKAEKLQADSDKAEWNIYGYTVSTIRVALIHEWKKLATSVEILYSKAFLEI